ncbi:MAG: NAD(P)/FAD-dependent oxidoreductase, partial [Elusimicrobia bacterium]|nr:NAD(P)/FAD-dependent oxidoreductase [Elusimicrobiota bacterium]
MAKKIAIIGAGPGGYPCALKAKELGAEVTLVEKDLAGGVCLNRGCIPSKSYLDTAHRIEILREIGMVLDDNSAEFISAALQKISWPKIQQKRQSVVEKLRGALVKNFAAKGIKFINGTASFASPSELKINGAEPEKFDAVIIACGTNIFFPKPFEPVKEQMLDSDRVFEMQKLPSSVIVVGGGAIGLEFSCFFNALGVSVELVEMMPALMPGEDEAVCRVLQSSFERRGIKLHLGKTVTEVVINGAKKAAKLNDGSSVTADEILVCAGRYADLSALRLENAGLKWDRKGIKADNMLKTEVPGIF